MKKRQWEVERDAIAAALPAWADDTEDVPLVDLVKSTVTGFNAEISRLNKELELSKAAHRLAKIGHDAELQQARGRVSECEREIMRWRLSYAALIVDGTLAPDPSYRPKRVDGSAGRDYLRK